MPTIIAVVKQKGVNFFFTEKGVIVKKGKVKTKLLPIRGKGSELADREKVIKELMKLFELGRMYERHGGGPSS